MKRVLAFLVLCLSVGIVTAEDMPFHWSTWWNAQSKTEKENAMVVIAESFFAQPTLFLHQNSTYVQPALAVASLGKLFLVKDGIGESPGRNDR